MEHVTVSAADLDGLDGLDDWRFVLNAIRADFLVGSFAAAGSFVSAIAQAADAADHHPDVDLRYPGRVRVALSSHDAGGVTARDVELARRISALAAELRATVQHTAPQALEIAIDTMDANRIRPFWAAVLAYRDDDGTLVDPLRIGAPVWFQQMDAPRTERNRFHIDVSVPHYVAEARVAAALAAGGTLVSDRNARSWWVLADADGNEACVSTWLDR